MLFRGGLLEADELEVFAIETEGEGVDLSETSLSFASSSACILTGGVNLRDDVRRLYKVLN